MALAALAATLLLSLASGCKNEPALLIKATADGQVQQYDLYIRDDASQQIIFHSGFNPVLAPGEKSDDGTGTRDLTKEPVRIAVKLSKGGKYTVLLVGVIGDVSDGKPGAGATQFFWAGRYQIDGATSVAARLLTVQAGDDQDGDLFPDVAAFTTHSPEAAELYAAQLDLLDCDDKTDDPLTSSGKALTATAAHINPFAAELCGDGYDEDCNGNGDEACVDADKDGDPRGDDCDDSDATRHHANSMDPFPDPPNCCGYNLGKTGADANKSFLGDALLCPKARCGDGIDEGCRGSGANDPANDTACVIDADCDGYPAGIDCNDNDPTIHPGAKEICGDGINQSCGIVADSGCVACDLDGDGYERNDAAAGCPDKANTKPAGVFDCNDYDAGVHPNETANTGGKEGGTTANNKVVTGNLGLCRPYYQNTNVTTPTPRVTVAGWLVGDFDCNGTAYEGCDPTCDADGDGWDKDGTCGFAGPFDCNDSDPSIFPGAPDKCSDGVDSSCAGADTQCPAGSDLDGDGYVDVNKGGSDCDDKNPNTHPFAPELCNGVDDDCDKDVDEGNPDTMGNALVSNASGAEAITSCTDSNLGECGKTPGLCVCSHADPHSTINATNRNACPGDVTGSATPHCYGAAQPQKQTCDASTPDQDDDCDGFASATPAGFANGTTGNPANLADLGKACGLAQGPCKQAAVNGCDRTQTTSKWYGALATNADLEWLCDKDTSLPVPEVCDGVDNDCNGQLPATEVDNDGDHYLQCSPCTGVTFAGALIGCGDCDDTNANVHPGAADVCDGLDDDCNPATEDGAADCDPAGKKCCYATNGGNTCKVLSNDAANCGMCGNACNSTYVNACGSSTCICGSGPACGPGSGSTPGTWCKTSSCATCNTNDHCGANCTPCTAPEICKTDGSSCTGCNTDADCNDASKYCNGGVCATKTGQGGACSADNTCGTGHCTDNVCCDKSAAACGTCQSCALPGHGGTCTNTPAGQESNNECTGNVATCVGNACNGNGSCASPDGTVCGGPTCTADNQNLSEFQCAGGACSTNATTVACASHSCAGGACETCTGDGDCKDGAYPHCWPSSKGGTGDCYQKATAGEMCSVNGDCDSNVCVSGTCCGMSSAAPSGCNAQSCTGGTLTTYTCGGPNFNSCTPSTSSCGNELGCNGAACATKCTCTTSPCSTATCAPDNYCANNNDTMCTQCNTNAFCGNSCTACTPACNTTTNKLSGVCKGDGSGCTNAGMGVACAGDLKCANTTSCKTACTVDGDCVNGFYCKAGGTCAAQITGGGSACDPMNCEAANCKQCADSGGSACTGNGNTTCP